MVCTLPYQVNFSKNYTNLVIDLTKPDMYQSAIRFPWNIFLPKPIIEVRFYFMCLGIVSFDIKQTLSAPSGNNSQRFHYHCEWSRFQSVDVIDTWTVLVASCSIWNFQSLCILPGQYFDHLPHFCQKHKLVTLEVDCSSNEYWFVR